MSKSIAAIYDNGVFRPLGPVDLPDQTPVAVTPRALLGTGDGLGASAGAWGDAGEALDDWLAKLQEMRHSERSLLPPAGDAP